MTCVNVLLQPERVLVAVDSHGRDQQGAMVAMSKLWPLYSQRVIVAGAGVSMFVGFVAATLNHCADFDAMRAQMPATLPAMLDGFRPMAAARGLAPADIEHQMVLLAGWSPSEKRMKACSWERHEDSGGEFEPLEIVEHSACPFYAELSKRPAPRSAADLAELMVDQVRLARAEDPEWAGGGAAIVALLTRDGLTIGAVRALPRSG